MYSHTNILHGRICPTELDNGVLDIHANDKSKYGFCNKKTQDDVDPKFKVLQQSSTSNLDASSSKKKNTAASSPKKTNTAASSPKKTNIVASSPNKTNIVASSPNKTNIVASSSMKKDKKRGDIYTVSGKMYISFCL